MSSTATLSLPATLNHAGAVEFVKGLPVSLDVTSRKAGGTLSVDASALASFDSSALAVLLECRRRAVACGQTFAVVGASPRLTQLATLYGVAELLPAATP